MQSFLGVGVGRKKKLKSIVVIASTKLQVLNTVNKPCGLPAFLHTVLWAVRAEGSQ